VRTSVQKKSQRGANPIGGPLKLNDGKPGGKGFTGKKTKTQKLKWGKVGRLSLNATLPIGNKSDRNVTGGIAKRGQPRGVRKK